MKLNKYIDHTILKPDADAKSVAKICEEAKEYDFASVCVNSCMVKQVAEALKGTDVKTCAVVGFPLGAMTLEAKAFETKSAISEGATEIDMVINIGAVKDENWYIVLEDIKAVVKEAKDKALVKVIIETCLLTDKEKVKVCELALEAGAEYVKTSTGFSTGGATIEDVVLMKKTVGDKAKVKASGGVRTREQALQFIESGADRIGTSNGIAIVEA